jgi:hypothetical protein
VAQVLTFDRNPSINDHYAIVTLAVTGPKSTPRPGATVSRRETHRMAGLKHDKCSKPAISITCDPWSTAGSSAERSPRRAAQLLLLPAAQARQGSCCAASKMGPTLQLVDCSSILEGSAHTSHVSRAPCSQHVSGEIPSVQAVWRCAERQGRCACARRGESGALGLCAVDVGAGCRQRSSSCAPNAHHFAPLALVVVGAGRCSIAGTMRLDELYRTGYARRAVDGRRDVERCTTARLGRNVRISQILAT